MSRDILSFECSIKGSFEDLKVCFVEQNVTITTYVRILSTNELSTNELTRSIFFPAPHRRETTYKRGSYLYIEMCVKFFAMKTFVVRSFKVRCEYAAI